MKKAEVRKIVLARRAAKAKAVTPAKAVEKVEIVDAPAEAAVVVDAVEAPKVAKTEKVIAHQFAGRRK